MNEIIKSLVKKDKEEIERCQKSPCYFYNNYVRKEWQKELTEEEYDDFVKRVNLDRQRIKENCHSAYPLTFDEAYKTKTD